MSAERHIELKVGLLVTACLGLLIAFVIILGAYGGPSGLPVFIDVDSSAALKVGAPIKIAGVPAGKVQAVDYRGGAVDPAVGRPVTVRITLAVDPDKLATLTQSSRFYITNQGVLGEKYVEIDPLRTDPTPLQAGDILLGEPPLRLEVMAAKASRALTTLTDLLDRNEGTLDTLLRDAGDTMANAKRATATIDRLVADNAPHVTAALTKAHAIEDSLNHALGDGTALRALVTDTAAVAKDARAGLAPILRDARHALARLDPVADRAEALLQTAQGELTATTARIQAILADVQSITATVRDGRGTVGALLTDRETYDDIREMMKDLKRHPWKFIWKE